MCTILKKYKVITVSYFKMAGKTKLVRITTIPDSLKILLKNQIRYMSNNGYDVTMMSSDGSQVRELVAQEQVPHLIVPLTRKITPFKDLYCLFILIRHFLKIKPQIVHTHTPKAGTLGMIAAKLTGVPHRLHTVAGLPLLEAKGKKRTLLDFVEKITYACATHIYPNSKNLEDIILTLGYCRPAKMKVLGNGSSNGIDSSYFDQDKISPETRASLRVELNIDKGDFVFVFVGRMVGDKGVNELINAFLKLEKEKSNVKLLLVGPLETQLDPLHTESLSAIDSNTNIISIGFQKDVRPYFAISDALVFPSYREGFPNVVMQAGSMGLPSIVTDINGCNEIIVDGKNGIIIPVKDTEATYLAMKNIAEDEALRNRLKENAKPMIVNRYEQQLIWNVILQEYNNLVKFKK